MRLPWFMPSWSRYHQPHPCTVTIPIICATITTNMIITITYHHLRTCTYHHSPIIWYPTPRWFIVSVAVLILICMFSIPRVLNPPQVEVRRVLVGGGMRYILGCRVVRWCRT